MTSPVLLPRDVIPSHYKLDLLTLLEEKKFSGEVEIHIDVINSVSSFYLHAFELVLNEVSFVTGDKVIKGSAAESQDYVKSQKLTFEEALPVGKGIVKIQYDGIINNDMTGYYYSNYCGRDGKNHIMASTQFEPLDARRAFPCFDEPDLKASFTFINKVDSHLITLSNSPEVSVTEIDHPFKPDTKLKRYEFEQSVKMSTYLYTWVVADLDYIEGFSKGGVRIRVYTPPNRAYQGHFALDCAIKALDIYEEFFDLKYPLPKLDMVCITEFSNGAMEGWGLVTYREVDLLLDLDPNNLSGTSATATPQAKQRVAQVVTHELAHQWFGNLVTMKWWDGLWLNEGFAAYMETFTTDLIYPDYKMWDYFSTYKLSHALSLDCLRSSHPVLVPIAHAEEVMQVFDAISYSKGASIIRMLAEVLGPQDFKLGLQNYMKTYAYGNTTTPQLWEKWTEQTNGRINVSQLMDSWTSKVGFPCVKVAYDEFNEETSTLSLVLEQQRFVADGDASKNDETDETIWEIPLFVTTEGSKEPQRIIMTEKVQKFEFVLPTGTKNRWINLNTSTITPIIIHYSTNLLNEFIKAIKDKKISADDRAAILRYYYSLAKAGFVTLEVLVDLLRGFVDEVDNTSWTSINSILSGLYLIMENGKHNNIISEETFKSFISFGHSLIKNCFNAIKWESASDDHNTKLLRRVIFSLMENFSLHEEELVAEVKRRYNGHWQDESLVPSEVKTSIYVIALRTGGEKEYNEILEAFNSTSDNHKKKFTLNTLGSTFDKDLKLRTLNWCIKENQVKLQDFFYAIGSVASNLEGSILAWNYYKENFSYISEKLKNATSSLMDAVISCSTSSFCTKEHADDIEAFFKTHPLPFNTRSISQRLESIRTFDKFYSTLSGSKLSTPEFWKL